MGYQSDKQFLAYRTDLACKAREQHGGRLKTPNKIVRIAIMVLGVSLVVLFAWWFR